MFCKLIELECYPYDLVICVHKDLKKAFNKAKKKYKGLKTTDDSFIKKPAVAYTIDTPKGIYLLLNSKKTPVEYLVHETNHITYFMLTNIGIEPSFQTMETYAYHQQYIFNVIRKALKK